MSAPDSERTAPRNDLDAVIADYLQRVEAGQVPSREELLTAHPGLAEELAAFFADFDRIENRADAFRLGSVEPARPTVRYFGDYELLEEIARGGMGVVYKARQASLNRLVALKMILKGELATLVDRVRFRTEAEAAAGLDHPNIVPIYEVGEHDGHPYFSMKYVEGETLNRAPRADVRAEVKRLALVARAVQYAHQCGVLHRDLKPSNVLLDATGIPYVADFGLAKRFDSERSLTETGALIGTPRYMAPEQAEGRRWLTVAADVYSLGVVLYERLTGRVPFQAESALDLLRQVREAEPPRPSAIVPGLPRDLETVCLKCLQKEPPLRYASTGELADDLERWLRGEPILARPVGAVRRAWMWCRRNPVVAGLVGAVAAALLGGIALSSFFAVEADRRASAESVQRGKAEKAQEEAERHLVRSFLRPLGYNKKELDPAEVFALLELSQQESHVKLLFLREALSDSDTALRFARRSGRIVQVTVGSSEARRRAALELAAAKQRDSTADAQVRLAACWLAMELGSADLPAAPEALEWWRVYDADRQGWLVAPSIDILTSRQARQLAPVWGKELIASTDKNRLDWSRQGVLYAIGTMDGALIRELTGRVADGLAGVMGKSTAPAELASGGETLTLMAPHIHPAEASRAFDALVGALGKTTDQSAVHWAGQALVALARRLPPSKAASAVEALVDVLGRSRDDLTLLGIGNQIEALAPALNPTAATRIADVLVGVLSRATDKQVLGAALRGLKDSAPCLDSVAASRAFGAVVAKLGTGLTDDYNWHVNLNCLEALASRLEPSAASRAFDELLTVEDRVINDLTDCIVVYHGLAALCTRLDSAAVTRYSDRLVNTLTKATDGRKVWLCVGGLNGLTSRLDPPAVARVLDAYVSVLGKTNDCLTVQAVDDGLSTLAARLDPEAATRATESLISALGKPLSQNATDYQLNALAALAPRVAPGAASRAMDTLISLLVKSQDNYVAARIGDGLTAFAPHLDAASTVRASDSLVLVLVKDKKGVTDWSEVMKGVTALAPRLSPVVAARATDELTRLWAQADENRRWALTRGLEALASRVEPAQASRLAEKLLGAMSNAHGRDAVIHEGTVLASLAPRLDLAMAKRAAGAVAGALGRSTDLGAIRSLGEALVALAACLGPHTAEEFFLEVISRLTTRIQTVRDASTARALTKYCIELLDLPAVSNATEARQQLLLATLDRIDRYDSHTPVNTVVRLISDRAFLARQLGRPGCVGKVRQALLLRLEELAFPPTPDDVTRAAGSAAVAGLLAPQTNAAWSLTLVAARAPRQRHFRTLWDAVAWLNQHHPEIDLDAPPPPARRAP